jgi:hypothetical protein
MTGPTKIEQFGFSPEQLMLRELRRIPEERVTAVTRDPGDRRGARRRPRPLDVHEHGRGARGRVRGGADPDAADPRRGRPVPAARRLRDDPFAWRFGFDLSKVRVLQEDLYRQAQAPRPRDPRRLGNGRRGAPRARRHRGDAVGDPARDDGGDPRGRRDARERPQVHQGGDPGARRRRQGAPRPPDGRHRRADPDLRGDHAEGRPVLRNVAAARRSSGCRRRSATPSPTRT